MRNLYWGWISGTALGIGASVGVAEIAEHTGHSIQVEAIHQNVE